MPSVPFGARACRALRARVLQQGMSALPKGWQRPWAMQRIIATPPWANMRAICKVYDAAREKTRETGVQWTVGHIVPLNHPRVSGLHVEWNLTLEPAKMNFAKGNAWCEWHGDLFSEPEQLCLF